MQLRNYQTELVNDIFTQWLEHRRLLAQLPTGGGKTVIFAKIAAEVLMMGHKVLVLAHREELITQAHDKLQQAIPDTMVGIVKAGYSPNYLAPIQVASVQSLRNRLDAYNDFGLVIVDEAHHSVANTYRAILERYQWANLLGVTATPIRTDGTGLDDIYDHLITGPSVNDLINMGYLSPFKLYAAEAMKTKGVKTVAGDWSATQLAKNNDIIQLSGNLVESYLKYAGGKRCVTFAVTVEHSQAIAQRYNQAGIPAAHLDGNTPSEERREVMEAFRRGEIKVISNCALFDEGLDIPALEAVQIAKPTKSLSRWLQMCGRALRVSEGKSHAVIIDHTENYLRLGLPNKKHQWTLNGVEKATIIINSDSNNDKAISDKSIVEETIDLQEVDLIYDDWEVLWQGLREKQERYGLKKGWLYYQLLEHKPPLYIWEKFEEYMNYKKGYAWVQYMKQEGKWQQAS